MTPKSEGPSAPTPSPSYPKLTQGLDVEMTTTGTVTDQLTRAAMAPIPLNSLAKGVPPAAVLRMLSNHSRDELAGFITVAIGLLDLADGDADAEDATDLEDDFTFSNIARYFMPEGAGCPISDEDAGAYVEWHTMRGSQKRGPNILAGLEDDEEDDAAEEDDPSGQCDEDEINTGHDLVRYTPGSYGAGCPLADPGERSGHYGQDADI